MYHFEFFHYTVAISQVLVGVALFLATPTAIALVDFVGVVQMWLRPRVEISGKPCDDFVILVPIFNHMRYLRNAEYLAQYAGKVVLCTTAHESGSFYRDLNDICKRYGFQQHRSNINLQQNDKTRNPWKIFHHVLDRADYKKVVSEEGREALLIENTVYLQAPYCIFLDGDTICNEDLRQVIGDFRAREYDVASVRIVPSHATTPAEHMQSLEYRLSMDSRKVYPWLTSGACMVAKTDVLEHALRNHSHFFQGGDIEIGKLSRLLGYRVGHLETEFHTDVPGTTSAWFRQRIAWSSGDFRHAVINAGAYSWRHPLFFLYFTVVVYAMLPLRLWMAVRHPIILPIVVVIYWGLLYTFRWRYRSWHLFVLPFYGLINALIVTPLGILIYFQTAWRNRNAGIIRLRNEPRRSFSTWLRYVEEWPGK